MIIKYSIDEEVRVSVNKRDNYFGIIQRITIFKEGEEIVILYGIKNERENFAVREEYIIGKV